MLQIGLIELLKIILHLAYQKHLRNSNRFLWTKLTTSSCHWTEIQLTSKFKNWAWRHYELPKVETALNEMHQNLFFKYSESFVTGTIDMTGDKQDTLTQLPTPQPTIAIVGSGKEKKQCVKLSFVDKLIQLWRLRRSICEAKAEISVSGSLAKYTYKAGMPS